jgi:hypothetical protein
MHYLRQIPHQVSDLYTYPISKVRTAAKEHPVAFQTICDLFDIESFQAMDIRGTKAHILAKKYNDFGFFEELVKDISKGPTFYDWKVDLTTAEVATTLTSGGLLDMLLASLPPIRSIMERQKQAYFQERNKRLWYQDEAAYRAKNFSANKRDGLTSPYQHDLESAELLEKALGSSIVFPFK